MLKTLFKVFAILLAAVYVFSFVFLMSVMYSSNAYSKYHIRIDLKNNQNSKIETGFYYGDEKTENGYIKLFEEGANPYQITFEVNDNEKENLIFKVDIVKKDTNMIENTIDISLNEYKNSSKIGYIVDCENGEIIKTPENIDDNDIGKSMHEKLVDIIVMVRNVSLVCMILCIAVCFIIR